MDKKKVEEFIEKIKAMAAELNLGEEDASSLGGDIAVVQEESADLMLAEESTETPVTAFSIDIADGQYITFKYVDANGIAIDTQGTIGISSSEYLEVRMDYAGYMQSKGLDPTTAVGCELKLVAKTRPLFPAVIIKTYGRRIVGFLLKCHICTFTKGAGMHKHFLAIKPFLTYHSISSNSAKPAVIAISNSFSSAKICVVDGYSSATYSVFLYLLIDKSYSLSTISCLGTKKLCSVRSRLSSPARLWNLATISGISFSLIAVRLSSSEKPSAFIS